MLREAMRPILSTSEELSKREDQITQAKPMELRVPSDFYSNIQNNASSISNNKISEPASNPRHLEGLRLYTLVFGLCLSLLLSTLETTIVSTSLVSITNALYGFGNRDWVVTSYLLTYTGFLVIYAKFSDIFGAKFMILLALLIFIIFSITCGAAMGMTELIVFRAFQGIGGSGIYSMVGVIVTIVVPPAKYGKYMAIISSVFAVASVLGPVLGGAINERSSWRWVFLLNAPAGATAIFLIAFFLPSSISSTTTTIMSRLRTRFNPSTLRKLDLIGAVLMLTASILLVFSLEEAGTRYAWSSLAILCTLVIAVISWIAFVVWELFIERKEKMAEPIFPMRLLKNRVLAGMLLNAFLTGFPFTSIVVILPQRFQAVNSFTPTRAGLSLLPILLISPFASALSALLTSQFRVPPLYLIIAGSIAQFLGLGLMCSLSGTNIGGVEGKIYGFEVIMGLGFGLVLTSLLALIPLVVGKKDMPVVIGAVTQVRVLGGTIGLAISSTILNLFVKKALGAVLSEMQIVEIGQSLDVVENLGVQQQEFVRRTFAEGYKRVMWIIAGFSGLVVLSSLLMFERKPRRHDPKINQDAADSGDARS